MLERQLLIIIFILALFLNIFVANMTLIPSIPRTTPQHMMYRFFQFRLTGKMSSCKSAAFLIEQYTPLASIELWSSSDNSSIKFDVDFCPLRLAGLNEAWKSYPDTKQKPPRATMLRETERADVISYMHRRPIYHDFKERSII
ncbi:hypothetical protein MFRU_008g02830 [Monilinia fructicola]|nr:hypothetical protein MFRU_008g02830 [Monilinia fructicola]